MIGNVFRVDLFLLLFVVGNDELLLLVGEVERLLLLVDGDDRLYTADVDNRYHLSLEIGNDLRVVVLLMARRLLLRIGADEFFQVLLPSLVESPAVFLHQVVVELEILLELLQIFEILRVAVQVHELFGDLDRILHIVEEPVDVGEAPQHRLLFRVLVVQRLVELEGLLQCIGLDEEAALLETRLEGERIAAQELAQSRDGLFPVTEFLVGAGELYGRLLGVRGGLAGLFERRYRLLAVARLAAHDAEKGEVLGLLRFFPQECANLLGCLAELAGVDEEPGEIGPDLEVVRVLLEQVLELLYGRIFVAVLYMHLAHVDGGVPVLRVRGQSGAEVLLRLVVALLVGVEYTEVVVRLQVIGRELQYVSEGTLGLLVPADFLQGYAEIVQPLDPARLALERPLVLRNGAFGISRRFERHPEVVAQRGVVLVVLEALSVPANRLVEIALLVKYVSEIIVCERILGIVLYRFAV